MTDIQNITKELKKESLNVNNRLKSIDYDSNFVISIQEKLNNIINLKSESDAKLKFPLVANLRCGLWYLPEEKIKEKVYFKSTDGHINQWSFSTRRLNLNLLDLISKNGACIIVDSTRKGKTIPDGLSKTIPIWCAVLNNLILEQLEILQSNLINTKEPSSPYFKLNLPKWAISKSECSQIENLIKIFVNDAKSVGLNGKEIMKRLSINIDNSQSNYDYIPFLYPFFITPQLQQDDKLLNYLKKFPFNKYKCFPLILVTASKSVSNGIERLYTPLHLGGGSFLYVQGAADDDELWADKFRLTSKIFWENKEKLLLATNESQVLDVVNKYLERINERSQYNTFQDIKWIKDHFLGYSKYIKGIENESTDFYIIDLTNKGGHNEHDNILWIPLPEGKKGSRILRQEIDKIVKFAIEKYNKSDKNKFKLLCMCDTGSDFSVAIILILMLIFYDENLNLQRKNKIDNEFKKHLTVSKLRIRSLLVEIAKQDSMANPSRATLQSVNAYLMNYFS